MKQFNLDEYLKDTSRKVVTRDGKPVIIHCTNHEPNWPVLAKIEGSDSSMSYQSDGRYCFNDDSTYDLFFATEKHEGWINIYKSSYTGAYFGDEIYQSREYAEEMVVDRTYIATVKIEREE